jgi:transaldolase/glucose-6-phosphate isomerase
MQPVGVVENAKATNHLTDLLKFGQSAWLDYIRRDLLTTGELKRMIDEDGLRGMTSNPAIFEKAISGGSFYDDFLKTQESKADFDAKARYEALAIRDIQDAADVFRPVYESTKFADGYVSLEVSPYLAHETEGTLSEARRLWKAVNRPNIMIKVPGTAEGVPAFQQLISEGINVNVTLLFSQQVYEDVARAYVNGVEKLAASGGDVSKIASVASFFVSRIDASIEKIIEGRLKTAKDAKEKEKLQAIDGKVAIANAKLAYQSYLEIFAGDRWKKLAAKGSKTQRVLWASTGTKNPKYRDVLYIEELVGADTVNTIPPATFDAFREHGIARAALTEKVDDAKKTMAALAAARISMKEVTDKLTADGVRLFEEAFDKLLEAVEKQTHFDAPAKVNDMTYKLPENLQKELAANISAWRAKGSVRGLWQGDPEVWTKEDENKWVGWLDITEEQLAHKADFQKLAEDVKAGGFTDVLLLGMGGSSLAPEVFAETFGHIKSFPKLHVLDSTDPAQIKSVESKVDLAKTLFIVSSKSGSTLEPNIFKQYFFERAKQVVGADKAGSRFIAVTDPGSKLEQVAKNDKFRAIFAGKPSIGGRYSALSNFGIVPAAAMGVDTGKFLEQTQKMVEATQARIPVGQNPGVVLGIILGAAASNGSDKLTIFTSASLSDVGAWLEQLIAESTGKLGKGVVPVDRETIGDPEVYGKDRVFAYLHLASDNDAAQDAKISALEDAGYPVVRITLKDVYELGQEFFRWEIATAVAGAVLGINPFNQPDVEASKIVTKSLTSEYEKKGSLPEEKPLVDEGGIKLFTDPKNAEELIVAAGEDQSLAGLLTAHLDRIGAGDYFALLAYLEMNATHEAHLQEIRLAVRDQEQVATCLGFGPRFLHSTGQDYKGGPNSGVFVQITCDDANDLPVPDQKYTFGIVKAAQARGDFQVLADRGRRALRIHLGADVESGLTKLISLFRQALS